MGKRRSGPEVNKPQPNLAVAYFYTVFEVGFLLFEFLFARRGERKRNRGKKGGRKKRKEREQRGEKEGNPPCSLIELAGVSICSREREGARQAG